MGDSAFSPLTRHMRCCFDSPLESLLLLSGDEAIDIEVASEPDSHSSVLWKRFEDAKEEEDLKVDTVEADWLALTAT